MGKQAAQRFKQGWREVSGFIDTSMFNYSMPANVAFGTNFAQMNGAVGYEIQQKQDSINEEQLRNILKETQPQGDLILNVDGDTLAKINLKQLNRLSQKSGKLALQV
jgi:hypothetical protein